MDRLEAMRRRAEYDQYELQRLEDKEMRKGGTHHIDHFSKKHNEVPRMAEEESSSDEEEEEAPKSGFESMLPTAAAAAAGAVLGYRNRKTIRKGVKAVKSGVKAGVKAGKVGIGKLFGRIKARIGH